MLLVCMLAATVAPCGMNRKAARHCHREVAQDKAKSTATARRRTDSVGNALRRACPLPCMFVSHRSVASYHLSRVGASVRGSSWFLCGAARRRELRRRSHRETNRKEQARNTTEDKGKRGQTDV